MLLFDAALRISAITLLLLSAVLALRDARHLLQGRLLAAMAISLSAMLIQTMPEEMRLPGAFSEIFWILHMPNTVLIWLFGLSLFQDDFRMKPVHWAMISSVLVVMGLIRVGLTIDSDGLLYITVITNRIIGFGILSHLIWTAVSGRRDDLVETRRRTRLWFVLGIAITAVLIISGETAHFFASGTGDDPDWLSTLRTSVAWPMVLFGALWFLNLKPQQFLFETTEPQVEKPPSVDPKDAAAHKRLLEAMEKEAYTQTGLTIGVLAENLNVPEHQLRALINQGLGYRNFSSFLNSHRIEYAKRLLSDPESARIPVLTIAMDAGYNSLAPFNRAFKAKEGVTPTAYRQATLSKTSQS